MTATKNKSVQELESELEALYAEQAAAAAADAQRRQQARNDWAQTVYDRAKDVDAELAEKEPPIFHQATKAAAQGDLQGAWNAYISYHAHRQFRGWARNQAEQAATVLEKDPPLPMLRAIDTTFPEFLGSMHSTVVESAAGGLIDDQSVIPAHPDEVS